MKPGKKKVDWLETAGLQGSGREYLYLLYAPHGHQRGLKPGTTNRQRQTNKQTNKKGLTKEQGKEKPDRTQMGGANPHLTGGHSSGPNWPSKSQGADPTLLHTWVLGSGLVHRAAAAAQPSISPPSTQWHEKTQAQWLHPSHLPWQKVTSQHQVAQGSNFHPSGSTSRD